MYAAAITSLIAVLCLPASAQPRSEGEAAGGQTAPDWPTPDRMRQELSRGLSWDAPRPTPVEWGKSRQDDASLDAPDSSELPWRRGPRLTGAMGIAKATGLLSLLSIKAGLAALVLGALGSSILILADKTIGQLKSAGRRSQAAMNPCDSGAAAYAAGAFDQGTTQGGSLPPTTPAPGSVNPENPGGPPLLPGPGSPPDSTYVCPSDVTATEGGGCSPPAVLNENRTRYKRASSTRPGPRPSRPC